MLGEAGLVQIARHGVLRKDGFQDAQVITSVKRRQTSNVVYALRTERAALTHRFAFISNRDGAFDIWTADQTGADVQRWTSLRWQHAPLQAALASDGSSLAVSVESARGVKDAGMIREFCAAVREADASTEAPASPA